MISFISQRRVIQGAGFVMDVKFLGVLDEKSNEQEIIQFFNPRSCHENPCRFP